MYKVGLTTRDKTPLMFELSEKKKLETPIAPEKDESEEEYVDKLDKIVEYDSR